MKRGPNLASYLLLATAAGGSCFCGGREQAHRQPAPADAGGASTAGGADEASGASADDASSGGQILSSGGNGGLQLPALTCGAARCSGQQSCCATPTECGYPAPASVFGTGCIGSTYRAGELSSACPPSDEYCHGELCETFAGCTNAEGACGFWVTEYSIWDAEMRIVVSAQLGCVVTSELANQ